MHGIIRPVSSQTAPTSTTLRWRAAIARVRAWRNFLLVVMVPTLLVSGYYYLIAADQYVSEAHYTVSASGAATSNPGGFGQLFGLDVTSPSQSAANNLNDYLRSHDVVAQLQPRFDLVAMFRRPEADAISRLGDPAPTPEALLKYFRGKVSVRYDRDTGLSTLQVHTFRPADSYRLASALLVLGERRVNEVNQRGFTDAVASAQRQLDEAEVAAAQAQNSITSFRQNRGDIDPQSSGEAQLRLVSELKGTLAAARAQLTTMAGVISQSSPQYVALARQVRSLEGEVAAQSRSLAGGHSAIASTLGGFESLQVRRDFTVKRYDAAAAAMEKAREDARRQQLYLVRVVDVNRPVKSLYPQRARIVLTLFLGLLLSYGIGWLIVAGVREHAA